MCLLPRSTRKPDLAKGSSFGIFRFQSNGIQNRQGGTVLAFVLCTAKLVEGPMERPFQASFVSG
jgi:hypothetical protein